MIHSFLLACHVVDQFTMIFREHDLIEYMCTKTGFDLNFYSIRTKINILLILAQGSSQSNVSRSKCKY